MMAITVRPEWPLGKRIGDRARAANRVNDVFWGIHAPTDRESHAGHCRSISARAGERRARDRPRSVGSAAGGYLSAAAPRAVPRSRYLTLALATTALGLAVHLYAGALGSAIQDVIGDALWATMVAWWIGVLAPDAPLLQRSTAALAIAFAVELSQLYHTPTLDAIRATTLGTLVLGSGFDPRDLVAYALGVLLAFRIERGILRRDGARSTADYS